MELPVPFRCGSFCKRLTSQTENVSGSVHVTVMDRSAFATDPFSYSKAFRSFRTADNSAFGTDLSAEVFGSVHERRCARNRLIPQHVSVATSGPGRTVSFRAVALRYRSSSNTSSSRRGMWARFTPTLALRAEGGALRAKFGSSIKRQKQRRPASAIVEKQFNAGQVNRPAVQTYMTAIVGSRSDRGRPARQYGAANLARMRNGRATEPANCVGRPKNLRGSQWARSARM